jgi:hypothetical protein
MHGSLDTRASATRTDILFHCHFEPNLLSAVKRAAIFQIRLEHFRFSSNHENALSLCFHAIPDAKPLHTFAGIALARFRSLYAIPGAKPLPTVQKLSYIHKRKLFAFRLRIS